VSEPEFVRRLWATPEARQPVGAVAAPGSAQTYALRALSSELDKLEHTPEGGRNHQLNVSAFNLAQLVLAGHLDYESTWASLTHAAHSIGLGAHETQATLQSAFRSASPRAVPELDKINEATVYAAPDDAEKVASVRDRLPAIDWQALWEDDSEEEWIIQPILPARRLVALFSAPKVGKSLLLLELAVAMARGEPVLGTTLDRPRRVMYVDFENDPRGDVRSRLVAMHRKPSELENLVYLSFPSLPGLDTKIGAWELLEACREYAVEVVVIDTISRAVQGEENENDTWLGFYRHTGLALKQAGIASIRLDHTGKDPEKGMRGGSAKYGDVDAVWQMSAVSDTTLRLECKANRMPISEKVLVLERELEPLRHTVRGNIGAALAAARHGQVIASIDELFGAETRVGTGTDVSLNAVEKALRAEGKGVRRVTLIDALEERDLRFGITRLFTYEREDQ